MSGEMSAKQAQYHNHASAWHPHPTHPGRNPSQSSNRYLEEAHRSTHTYNPGPHPNQQHQLNTAIMSAKIETSQPVPCNQQQVMPSAGYEAALEHPSTHGAPPLASVNPAGADPCHYAAHRLNAADLRPNGKESESKHAKYLLDGYMKGSMTTE